MLSSAASARLEVYAPCEDALETTSDGESAAEEVLCVLADNVGMSWAGFGGLGGAEGVEEDIEEPGGEV